MASINILNKEGYLTNEDRKQPIEHGCDYFTFKTCIDLSEPIKVIPYGNLKEYELNKYSIDIASFICWWTNFVHCDLNGFSGFNNLKFELIGFEIVKNANNNSKAHS